MHSTARTLTSVGAPAGADTGASARLQCARGAAAVQHIATQYNMAQHSTTQCTTMHRVATRRNTVQHSAPRCNTAHHVATQRTTLQHSATQCTTAHHRATQHMCAARLRFTRSGRRPDALRPSARTRRRACACVRAGARAPWAGAASAHPFVDDDWLGSVPAVPRPPAVR